MPAYLYRAVDSGGKRTKGLVEAANPAAARADLRRRDLLPLQLEATTRAAGRSQPARGRGLGMSKLVLVTRQLATLVGAQVRIEDALKIIADQMRNARDASVLLNLRSEIVDGRSFAQALETAGAGFDAYFRASVRAGEQAGRLGEVLEHLAAHIDTRARNRQSLTLAMIYPALLLLVSVGVIVALLAFVVPDIVRVFTTRGVDLPALTRGLIAASDFVQRWWAVLLGGGLAVVLGTALALRRPALRARIDRRLTRLPLLGPLVLRLNAAQFSGTLATLVQSGVPLAEALVAAEEAVSNGHVRAQVAALAQRVRDGAALSTAVQETGVFPPMLTAMIASGEASGRLGDSLSRAADDQSASLKATVATIVALVEPGVLLVMGGVVMLLVMAILMPIVGLNSLAG